MRYEVAVETIERRGPQPHEPCGLATARNRVVNQVHLGVAASLVESDLDDGSVLVRVMVDPGERHELVDASFPRAPGDDVDGRAFGQLEPEGAARVRCHDRARTCPEPEPGLPCAAGGPRGEELVSRYRKHSACTDAQALVGRLTLLRRVLEQGAVGGSERGG